LISIPLSSATQSLGRLCVTGSGIQNPGLVANLIGYSDVEPRIELFLRPGNNSSSPYLKLSLNLPEDLTAQIQALLNKYQCEEQILKQHKTATCLRIYE
jgi:hypothetical protein